MLRTCFGEAFSDPKFDLKLLWKCVFFQKIIGINRHVPWPVNVTSVIKSALKIKRGTRMPGLSKGCYLDGRNGIEFGENTWVGPDVKVISMNHDVHDFSKYVETNSVKIGRNCWLGANSVILPGVELGDHTVVAAGAVVTGKFPDGDQILGGVPARVVKRISTYDE